MADQAGKGVGLKQVDAEIEQATAAGEHHERTEPDGAGCGRNTTSSAPSSTWIGDTVSRIDQEKAKLALADAQQKLKELEAKIKFDTVAMEPNCRTSAAREKALFDLQRAERGLQNLELKAPAAGMVNILPNYRAGSGGGLGGGEVEFDRAIAPGPARRRSCPICRPVHLEARLDESDRGRLSVGKEAVIRIQAIPGKEFKARIERISVLARADFHRGGRRPETSISVSCCWKSIRRSGPG